MLIEIGLLRRFTVFLGHPIHALAVVLFSLLISAGFGSLAAARFSMQGLQRQLTGLLSALVLLFILYILALPPILTHCLALALPLRILVVVTLLAPLGFVMGMPLPLGMRLFHRDSETVAWSWGINSATSVFGAIFATVLAMNVGFTWTLLAGVATYLLALGAVALRDA
jgi:predicted membrane-bound spermidine synthase